MDEKTLIERAGKGDEQAFEELVVTYEKRIYNLVLRMIGDREDAFDLTQETFVKAWHAIALFQFDSKFVTWLCRIASNTCIDYLRKKRRTFSLTSLDDEDTPYETAIADSSSDPASLVEKTLDREAVYRALQELPTDYRMALTMRAVEDMTYEEIGEALSLRPGTVKSRIARARERMRKSLGGNFSSSASSKKEKGGR